LVDKVFVWTVKIEVPFHHGLIQRWEGVMVDFFGNRVTENLNCKSLEEADAKIKEWEIAHPDVRVFTPNARIYCD
jgi:hypothetical protein